MGDANPLHKYTRKPLPPVPSSPLSVSTDSAFCGSFGGWRPVAPSALQPPALPPRQHQPPPLPRRTHGFDFSHVQALPSAPLPPSSSDEDDEDLATSARNSISRPESDGEEEPFETLSGGPPLYEESHDDPTYPSEPALPTYQSSFADDEILDDDLDDYYEDFLLSDEDLDDDLGEVDEEEEEADLETCGVVVRWGEAGMPPPVPSRDDPSHQLSEMGALTFLKQKDEVPEALDMVRDDPRLKRLKLKWAPNIFMDGGTTQIAKNMVGPQCLPYIGFLFHVNNVREAKRGHNIVTKSIEEAPEELQRSMDCLQAATVSRGCQELAYTGVAAACMALPVLDFIPGASAQLLFLGHVGTKMAESSIEMGLKVVISKSTGQVTQRAMAASTEAFGGYGTSKAFLLYLGLPKTDDPLYAPWESYRLKLKALYGVSHEDDLRKMEPKGRVLQAIRDQEDETGRPFEVEVPLLVLLWRAFDCWNDHYWDRFVRVKDTTKAKTKEKLGMRRDLTLDERRRMRDYRYLQHKISTIEAKDPIDPHLRILRRKRKKEIIELLTTAFLHSYRVSFLFSRKKTRDEQRENLRWFMRMVVSYFMDNDGYIWGYVGTDNRLKAVAIWDRPNENAQVSFSSMLRKSGAIKLGPNRWRQMNEIVVRLEEIRKKNIRGLRCWMLHWLAVDPQHQGSGLGKLLVKNTMQRHDEPIYLQAYSTEQETMDFFKHLCFLPVYNAASNFSLYGQPVNVVAYWHGMSSPDELRAQLPKKRNPLKLTYSTIRRASSQALIQRSANKLLTNQPTEERLLLTEARNRYEEMSTLLDHLKINLASLPTEGRESDPLALSLVEKIREHEHLLQTYRTALDDAQVNCKVP